MNEEAIKSVFSSLREFRLRGGAWYGVVDREGRVVGREIGRDAERILQWNVLGPGELRDEWLATREGDEGASAWAERVGYRVRRFEVVAADTA